MKKNLFRTLLLAAGLLLGTPALNAQKGYEVPAPSAENAELAQQVIDLQFSDPDAANKAFTKLVRKIKNKKEELLAVGQMFLENNNPGGARQCAKQLYEIAPDYIPGLMFNGEVCMLFKDYGAAGQKFDEVLVLDSLNVYALKRNAFVYKNINPHVAIEMLETIQRIEPSDYNSGKELGDIFYNMNDYPEAVKYYKSYFANVPKAERDIRAAENYLQSLYATQKFMEAGQLVKEFEQLDPKDMVFKRMKLFCAVENYELDVAKDALAYIAEMHHADSLYLYLDYAYAANLMKELGDLPAAIGYMERALRVDSTKLSGYKELAALYRQNKQIDEGLSTYKLYLDKMGDKADLTDVFGLGQQYVAAAGQENLSPDERARYVAEGDALFAHILEQKPDAYQALLMRAAINITDRSQPEDKVKDYYEQAYRLMKDKEGIDSSKLQALGYLAFYCVQKDQYKDARTYCDAILAINPEHPLGKQIDSFLKGMDE